MCEILVFWFRDSVWWKAAMLSIIGAWLALLVSWSHTASHWKTPNSNPTSPCAVLTGFKSMHADRDCNLRWVAVKGSLRDNLISHSAQRKTVLRAGNKCLFNIFPSLCKGQVLCKVLSSKTSANEKRNQINIFLCLLCPAGQYSCHKSLISH